MSTLLSPLIKLVSWRAAKGGGGPNNNYRLWETSNKNKLRTKSRPTADNEDFMSSKIITTDINIVHLTIMFLENLIKSLHLNFDYGLQMNSVLNVHWSRFWTFPVDHTVLSVLDACCTYLLPRARTKSAEDRTVILVWVASISVTSVTNTWVSTNSEIHNDEAIIETLPLWPRCNRWETVPHR